jgi:hypothetical protein
MVPLKACARISMATRLRRIQRFSVSGQQDDCLHQKPASAPPEDGFQTGISVVIGKAWRGL